jgi:DNA polymerase zeta
VGVWEELGYKIDGQTANKGGDWKISEELWGMIQERMSDEKKKKGSLTFERFSTDVANGRSGEKRKYDKVSRLLS